MGEVIFLHGASSSGKSTIAGRLQAVIDQPFLHYSIDHLRDAGVWPWDRFRRGDFAWSNLREQFFDGFHLSLAGFVAAGHNVILEHVLDTEGWLDRLQGLLADRDVFFVGVHCDLDELRRRERARADRPAGSAEADFHAVQRDLRYDLVLHTGDADPDALVAQLLSAWRTRRAPGIFHTLSQARR